MSDTSTTLSKANTLAPMLRVLRNWVTPRATDHDEAFRERNLRVLILLGVLGFSIFLLVSVFQTISTSALEWYVVFYGIAFATSWAIRVRRIRLAAYIATSIVLLIPLDPSAAYWSPGTVALSAIFTFVFLLFLPNTRELVFALLINLSVYAGIVVTETEPSPLSPDDFYASPSGAFLTTLIIHVIILGMGYYIRRDQADRDRHALLIEQQRVDILRQFISHASHDINTPLTRIKMDLYLLDHVIPDEHKERVTRLEDTVDHLENTFADMLEMSRLGGGIGFDPALIGVRQLMMNIVPAYQDRAAAKGLTLDYASGGSLEGKIWADEKYIQRAIGNIIDNAITFTPKGGTITIHTQQRSHHAIIEVIDNGIGIAPEVMLHIFDSFYRADAARPRSMGKAGLGLSISKKVIEIHNGDIEVESHVGEGSTFRVILPLVSH